jgi:nucleoside-diphosphate-sugar epimerase
MARLMSTPERTIDRGTALVTGATGFIGRNLVAALQREGYRVRALVREGSNIAGLEGIEPFHGDLRQPESLVGIERGVDVVFHAASLLGKWGTDEALLHEVNVRGATSLLERFTGTELQRYVHLSAGGVTGPLSGWAVDESYACRPATPYERTKYEAERAVLARSKELSIPALVVRPTFTYGPGDPHKVALFRAIRRGRYAFVGGGTSVNHPVYVDDLVAGLLLALARGRVGEVYIVGGDRPVSKREFASVVAMALSVRPPWLSIPRWAAFALAEVLEWLGHRLGFEPVLTRSRFMIMADNFGYSIAKARSELGYAPRVDLQEGILRTVQAYRRDGLL